MCPATGRVRGVSAVPSHAEDDSCPSTILAADDDAWAAGRIADINTRTAGNGKKHTYGEFYDEDGTEHWYASGQDDAADLARDVGRDAGVFPASGTVATVEHVEVKAAAQMRRSQIPAGVLVINNPDGPCGRDTRGQYSCTVVVPKLLPPDASLVVWWPRSGDEHPDHETFPGGAR